MGLVVSRKIKICHFADHITGKADGIFTHILQIVKFTNPEIFEHSLCYQGGDIICDRFQQTGGVIFPLNSIKKKIPIRAIFSFIKLCKREQFDIIQAHFLKPYIISSFLQPFFCYKVIYNYNGSFIENEFNSKFEQVIYKLLHYLICYFELVELAIVPSNESKRILLTETRLFPLIEVYYNCYEIHSNNITEITEIPPLIAQLKGQKLLVGIIARLYPQKRIDLALQIVKNINSNVHFIFCGDGKLHDEMVNYSRELSVENSTTFLGYIANIDRILKIFDIILFTSDYEGLPLTIWEAMANGVPIVSTDVGGIGEIIKNENCGILFPKGNITKGTEAILKVINNKELRIELGENGKRAIKNKYNPEIFGRRIEDLYQEVLDA